MIIYIYTSWSGEYIHIRVCVCIYICIYIYVYIYTYIYVYIYIYMYICAYIYNDLCNLRILKVAKLSNKRLLRFKGLHQLLLLLPQLLIFMRQALMFQRLRNHGRVREMLHPVRISLLHSCIFLKSQKSQSKVAITAGSVRCCTPCAYPCSTATYFSKVSIIALLHSEFDGEQTFENSIAAPHAHISVVHGYVFLKSQIFSSFIKWIG